MRDREFKNFPHLLPVGSSINSNGNALQGNYRPDISIKDQSDKIYIILESERKSERKAFIGAMVHAAKFAHDTQQTLSLVFVMKQTGNQTTVPQVSANIRPYYEWIKSLGSSHLREVLMLSDEEYLLSVNANEKILSKPFRQRCVQL
jgi:hypothetical protein